MTIITAKIRQFFHSLFGVIRLRPCCMWDAYGPRRIIACSCGRVFYDSKAGEP